MKKSELRQLVLEAIQGYSKYAPGGITKGGTTGDFRGILTAIAKSLPDMEDSEEDKARRGNAILDKANPKNVDRITRGEEPIYEEQGQAFSKQELIDYLNSLAPEMEVAIPQIHMSGNFDFNVKWRTTAAKAAQALSDTPKEGKFTLSQDNPTYKSFSLVQSPGELEKRTKFMQDFGGLD